MVLTPASAAAIHLYSPSKYLKYRSLIQRHHKQVSVWTGLNVGPHSEVSTDEQALAFGNVELAIVVGYAILLVLFLIVSLLIRALLFRKMVFVAA